MKNSLFFPITETVIILMIWNHCIRSCRSAGGDVSSESQNSCTSETSKYPGRITPMKNLPGSCQLKLIDGILSKFGTCCSLTEMESSKCGTCHLNDTTIQGIYHFI